MMRRLTSSSCSSRVAAQSMCQSSPNLSVKKTVIGTIDDSTASNNSRKAQQRGGTTPAAAGNDDWLQRSVVRCWWKKTLGRAIPSRLLPRSQRRARSQVCPALCRRRRVGLCAPPVVTILNPRHESGSCSNMSLTAPCAAKVAREAMRQTTSTEEAAELLNHRVAGSLGSLKIRWRPSADRKVDRGRIAMRSQPSAAQRIEALAANLLQPESFPTACGDGQRAPHISSSTQRLNDDDDEGLRMVHTRAKER